MPDLKDIDLFYAIGLPPEQAIQYFQSKGFEMSWNWYDLWQDAQVRSFTVAKVMRLDILQDIYDALDTAMKRGQSYESFRKEIEPTLREKGWWGKVPAEMVPGYDPSLGIAPDEPVQLGSPWRLKTIYRVNMQTNYMSGRFKSMMDNATNRPYWQYVAVMDQKTRPSHAELNGKVFRYDDPFWQYFYPPNGWNCRCRVRALSQRDLDRKGLKVESAVGKLLQRNLEGGRSVWEYHPAPNQWPLIPDVGFDYNPGRIFWQPDASRYNPEIGRLL